MRTNKYFISKEALFWFVLIILASISNVMFPFSYLMNLQTFFIFSVSIYWGALMMKGLLLKNTSNYLLLDLVNVFILVPILNFNIVKKFIVHTVSKQTHHSPLILQIGLGILISTPLLFFVIPLLIRADASSTLITFFQTLPTYFSLSPEALFTLTLTAFILPFMFSFFLSYSKRNQLFIVKNDYFETNKASFRVLPMSTTITAWIIILALYVFFIFAQITYLFSAFSGRLPVSSNLIYSAYARQGFFELCMIATINLMLMILTEILTHKRNRFMSYFYVTISVITVLLSFTALSKLALYISVYGLTPSRIISSSFVIFLAIVWIGIAIRQFKSFSIIRFTLIVGSIIVLLLCIAQIDLLSDAYNTWFHIL